MRFWKSLIDGADEIMPGLYGVVNVGSGVRRPAPRMSEAIANDASRRILFVVGEYITRMLPHVYLVHHHGLR